MNTIRTRFPASLRLCHTVLLVLAAVLCAAPVVLSAPAALTLRAGLAKVDISPAEPVTLAGYESRKDVSQGIHDPLAARALVFDANGDRLVIISVDNLGFYSGTDQPLRQAVLESCGLKPSQLLLSAIHTHSAPRLVLDPVRGHPNNVQYTKWLQQKLVEVTRAASGRLEPVLIGIGSGASPVGVNRREIVQRPGGKPEVVLGRNPSALIDREVQVLKLARAEGAGLAGVLFAYATHSTSLGPGNYLISGDVHGLAEQAVERYFGSGVIAPALAGASGDIDPWVRVLPDFRTNNGWLPEPVLMGTMLGQEVVRVAAATQAKSPGLGIRSRIETLQLPSSSAGGFPAGSGGDAKPFVVSVACVGDIAFVGWGGEVFNEIGKTVKVNSPFAATFVFTHCNGAAGYVPTKPSYAQGGYEVRSSSFAPGAGELLADETLRLLRELKQTVPR